MPALHDGPERGLSGTEFVSEPAPAADSRSGAWARLPRREGAFWVLVALGVPRLIGAIVTLALRRYLGPAVAGRFDLAYAPYRLLDGLRTIGVGPALVYERQLTQPLADTAWTLNLASAAGIGIVAQLLAHPVALYYNRPGIEGTFRVLSIAYVLTSLTAVHFFLLLRNRDFRARAIPAVGQVLIAGAVAVMLAVWGFGIGALVGRELASAAVGAVVLWVIVPFRPRPHIVRVLALRLLRYGVWICAGAVVLFLSQNVDVFIAGRVIRSARDIGFYTTSWDLAFLVAGVVSTIGSSMVFPALSRLQHDPEALGVRLLLALRQLGLIMLPAAAILAAAAPIVIVPVLGDKFGAYRGSYPVLTLLALYAANRTMLSIFFEAYKSVGRPHLLVGYNTARLAIVVPCMIVGAEHGILGLAVAYLPLQVLEVPLALLLVRAVLGVPPGAVWRALRAPLISAALMAATIVAAEATCLGILHAHDGVALVVSVPLSGMVFLAAVRLLDHTILREAWVTMVEGL